MQKQGGCEFEASRIAGPLFQNPSTAKECDKKTFVGAASIAHQVGVLAVRLDHLSSVPRTQPARKKEKTDSCKLSALATCHFGLCAHTCTNEC